MSELMAEWRAKKAQEEVDLHERVRAAVLTGKVEIYTDQRMLDFQGSPVHNSWDHIVPLMVLMLGALAILLATGVAIGIVAMTIGALAHLLGIKHFIAWRIRGRTQEYVLRSVAHWNQIWTMGGMVIHYRDSGEVPCYAPKGDWRKFVRRNLYDFAHPAPVEAGEEPVAAAEGEVLPP